MKILKKTDTISWAVEALDGIPGIGRQSAERILAEAGVEMEHFQNEFGLVRGWVWYRNVKKALVKR